jgi:hypothetical protein
MKNGRLYTIGLMLFGMVALGASPAKASTAAGSYYATPSWDQQLQCDTPSTCPRFIVLSNWYNAAVLDRETGLVWEQSPSTSTFNWLDAQGHCNEVDAGGRKGWRLPTLQELSSLVEADQVVPLPSGHPFSNVQLSLYWSATTYAGDATFAWNVDFEQGGGGHAFHFYSKNIGSILSVWCVRGGHGVDPQ